MYDTTIATPAGVNSLQVKFPQADPIKGMVTCVRLCITITGVIDTLSVENNSASPQIATVTYLRTDQITGPGLVVPMSNTASLSFNYPLGPTNGILGSGPDFASTGRDTLQNAVTVCGTINDSAALSMFYGHDSVTYNYTITAFTNVSCTGGNYNSTVGTSALVRFHFEYCTCPGYVLPLNFGQFFANRAGDNKVELKWMSFENQNQDYQYQVEMSRDGRNFNTITTIPKKPESEDMYRFTYTTGQHNGGAYYFRIKQISNGGHSTYSNIRQVNLESSAFPKFSVYPNPSDGIVGIKFDNISGGQITIQVFNTQGQTVAKKEIVAAGGSSYWQIASLQSGVYWLRVTDVTSRLSCVNQLLIK